VQTLAEGWIAFAALGTRLASYDAARRMITERSFMMDSSIVKMVGSEAAMDNARDVTQIFGGHGSMNENLVTPDYRDYRDAKFLEVGTGTSEVRLMVVSRAWVQQVAVSTRHPDRTNGSTMVDRVVRVDRVVSAAAEAACESSEKASITVGGTVACGIPVLLIEGFYDAGSGDPTTIDSNCGVDPGGPRHVAGWSLRMSGEPTGRTDTEDERMHLDRIIEERGLCREEFDVDDRYLHRLGRAVTEPGEVPFTTMTKNTQALHLDAEWASTQQFGKRLVKSMFALPTLPPGQRIITSAPTAANYRGQVVPAAARSVLVRCREAAA
jgi:hypothetical protein